MLISQVIASISHKRKQFLQQLKNDFSLGTPVEKLLHAHSQFIEETLLAHYPNLKGYCLLATAGFGRQELYPYSDIDVLILHADDIDPHSKILDFCQLLSDADIPLSHSIRTVSNSLSFAKTDLNFYTSLLETRYVCGDKALFQSLQSALNNENCWHDQHFLNAKLNEQHLRHQKFNRNIEPNLKESPGGLRDIQLLNWLVLHAKSTASAISLYTPEEQNELNNALSQVQTARFALHFTTNKAEDRLLFDYQKSLVDRLQPNVSVSEYMQNLQIYMQTIQYYQELGLQIIVEKYYLPESLQIELQANFGIRGKYLTVEQKAFSQHPTTILQSFIVLCERPDLLGFTADTIRALHTSHMIIDENYRKDPQHQALFLALFDQKNGIDKQITRMHRYGILSAYLPEFLHLTGQMQFDLFHHFTVDIHTFSVLEQISNLAQNKYHDSLPLATQVIDQIQHLRTLYLAGLFHDIGKGLGGDHATLGAAAMTEFCKNHNLSTEETELLAWLVQHHLLMSLTAQKTDIANPEVVERFAKRVGNKLYLDHLYLLTICDIRGTNLTLWNDWKSTLLNQLYQATVKILETREPADLHERVLAKQQQILHNLSAEHRQRIAELWLNWPNDYFLHFSQADLDWQTKNLEQTPPVIAIRNHPEHKQCEVFLYLQRRPSLFTLVTSTIDRLGLTIAQAKFYTLANDYLLHHYVVLEQSGATLNDRLRLNEIKQQLTRYLTQNGTPKIAKRRHIHKQIFEIPTQIRCQTVANIQQTQIEIIAQDRPGLLASIAQILDQFAITVHAAKIATFGQRAEDSFYVTDNNNQILSNELQSHVSEKLNNQLSINK